MLKPNDIVNIYQDPITESDLEGRAKLVKRINKCCGLERWYVKFLDTPEDANCMRNIFTHVLLLAVLLATQHNISYQTFGKLEQLA